MILNIVDLFLKILFFILKFEIVNIVIKKMDCLIFNLFIFYFGIIERVMIVNILEVKDCVMMGKRGRV